MPVFWDIDLAPLTWTFKRTIRYQFQKIQKGYFSSFWYVSTSTLLKNIWEFEVIRLYCSFCLWKVLYVVLERQYCQHKSLLTATTHVEKYDKGARNDYWGKPSLRYIQELNWDPRDFKGKDHVVRVRSKLYN